MKSEQSVVNWLAYTIRPEEVRGVRWPAMWGNGQLQCFADLERPCVNQVVCFGLTEQEGLDYQREQHMIPAVNDDETGKKYLLDRPVASRAKEATCSFRPDRQTWRYEFDDLVVEAALIFPRTTPGYLLRVRLEPLDGNTTKRWRVYHQLRAHAGNALLATEAESDLAGGKAWLRNKDGLCEAIGSTSDASRINLGIDYDYANDIMIKHIVERDGEDVPDLTFARGFGTTLEEAKANLAPLLASHQKLEAESETWWSRYLSEVPGLEIPDEIFEKNYLWSWANFRMNRLEVPLGIMPAGMVTVNNCRIKPRVALSLGDPVEIEVIQHMHDPKPARDAMLFLLRNTRKQGLMSVGFYAGKENPGNYPECLGWLAGLVHKYILSTGDIGLLSEEIGDGLTFLERMENGLEAQLPQRDEKTGLFWNDGEMKRFGGLYPGEFSGMGPVMEAVTRIRGARGTYHSEVSANVWGTFVAMADIEELAGNGETSARYRTMADDLGQAIRNHLWDEESGMFRDLDENRNMTEYMGMGGFITGLFANHTHQPGGLATSEQAERLAEWCNHSDFVSDYGTICLARRNPYYDAADYKGYNSNFDMHWSNQVPSGLYHHGCYEEAHRQLFKMWRRLEENAGLGPRYRGECYHADTSEILENRFVNYPCILSALGTIFEGVFGMRWTKEALTVHVNSPWPWAKLSNIRIRDSLLELDLQEDGTLIARIDGKEAARSEDRKLALPWESFYKGTAKLRKNES